MTKLLARFLSPFIALLAVGLSIVTVVVEFSLNQLVNNETVLEILQFILYSSVAVILALVLISITVILEVSSNNPDLLKEEIKGFQGMSSIFAFGVGLWALIWLVNREFQRVEAFFTIFTVLSGATIYSLNKKRELLRELSSNVYKLAENSDV